MSRLKKTLTTDININQLNRFSIWSAEHTLYEVRQFKKKMYVQTQLQKKLLLKSIIWHIDAEIDSQY